MIGWWWSLAGLWHFYYLGKHCTDLYSPWIKHKCVIVHSVFVLIWTSAHFEFILTWTMEIRHLDEHVFPVTQRDELQTPVPETVDSIPVWGNFIKLCVMLSFQLLFFFFYLGKRCTNMYSSCIRHKCVFVHFVFVLIWTSAHFEYILTCSSGPAAFMYVQFLLFLLFLLCIRLQPLQGLGPISLLAAICSLLASASCCMLVGLVFFQHTEGDNTGNSIEQVFYLQVAESKQKKWVSVHSMSSLAASMVIVSLSLQVL